MGQDPLLFPIQWYKAFLKICKDITFNKFRKNISLDLNLQIIQMLKQPSDLIRAHF